MKLNRETTEKIMFFLFLLSLPLTRRHTFFQNVPTNDLSLINLYASDLFLLIWLGFGFITRKYKYKTIWLGTMALIAIIAVFCIIISRVNSASLYIAYSYVKWIELLLLAIYLGIITSTWSTANDFYKVVTPAISLGGIFQSILATLQFLMQHSIGLHWLGEPVLSSSLAGIAKIDTPTTKLIRGYGTFPHPNPLSAYIMVACATSAYGYLCSENSKYRRFYGFSLILCLLGSLMSFSRAGIVVSYVTLAILLTLAVNIGKTYEIKAKKAILASFIVGLGLFGAFLPYLRDRTTSNIPTPYNRTYYNHMGIDVIRANHLGVGLGNMLNTLQMTIKPREKWQTQPPHNYFLEVGIEWGVLGIILFTGLIIYLYKISIEMMRIGGSHQVLTSVLLLSILTGFILVMFFDHYFYTIQQTQLLLWLIIGLILGQRKIKLN